MTSQEDLVKRGTLIGKDIVITRYQDAARNTPGVVRDETRFSFLVETDAGKKRFLKDGLVFLVSLRGRTLEVKAECLIGRLTERIKNRA